MPNIKLGMCTALSVSEPQNDSDKEKSDRILLDCRTAEIKGYTDRLMGFRQLSDFERIN
jgi:hypothetical protein